MQHYIAIYAVSKEKSTRHRKSKHSLKLYNPTPEQSKCCFWTHQCTTHTPAPSLSKRCERFRRVPCRGEGRYCHFLLGEKTQHTHLTKNIEGYNSELEVGSTTTVTKKKKKNQIIPNQTGRVGENKKLTDIENDPESPNENAIWISILKDLR